jgi:hypothetical protein
MRAPCASILVPTIAHVVAAANRRDAPRDRPHAGTAGRREVPSDFQRAGGEGARGVSGRHRAGCEGGGHTCQGEEAAPDNRRHRAEDRRQDHRVPRHGPDQRARRTCGAGAGGASEAHADSQSGAEDGRGAVDRPAGDGYRRTEAGDGRRHHSVAAADGRESRREDQGIAGDVRAGRGAAAPRPGARRGAAVHRTACGAEVRAAGGSGWVASARKRHGRRHRHSGRDDRPRAHIGGFSGDAGGGADHHRGGDQELGSGAGVA